MAAVGILFNNRILNLVNVPEDIFSDAALYLAIYFLGLPFLFMYNVQASIFNALGLRGAKASPLISLNRLGGVPLMEYSGSPFTPSCGREESSAQL